jgi:hypothetical protein
MGNACSSTQATAATSPVKAHPAKAQVAATATSAGSEQQASGQQPHSQQTATAGSAQFSDESLQNQNHSALETAAEYLEVEKAAVSVCACSAGNMPRKTSVAKPTYEQLLRCCFTV